MLDVFINVYAFVYTQTLVDGACNNLAAFIYVGGLAVVVALAYKWFNRLVWLLLYSFHVNNVRSFRVTICIQIKINVT